MTPVDRFQAFVQERHMVYIRRHEKNQPAPWTKDPIIGQYRFCNVYRQLDKVTKRMNAEYYPDFSGRMLPFAAVVGRLINWPDCLNALTTGGAFGRNLDTWRPGHFHDVLNERKRNGELIRCTAYIVSTNGVQMPFPEYITQYVLDPMWEQRDKLRPLMGDTLASYADRLGRFNGMGTFLVGQVLADLKYVHPTFTEMADFYDFVVSGPGSRRGLNRLYGRDHDTGMSERKFQAEFHKAVTAVAQVTASNGWEPMHAQDVQNCLCEWDKYERARLGQGTPKQKYIPNPTPPLF